MSAWLKLFNQLQEMETCFYEALKDTPAAGLTIKEAHVLLALRHENGATATQLARAAGCVPTAFTPVLDGLERKKLIRRHASETDRRALTIRLQVAAAPMIEPIMQALAAME